MITQFRQFISAKLTAAAVRLAGWAAIFAGPQPSRLPNSAPESESITSLPPFAGSAEEADALFEGPPAGKSKAHVIARVSDTGKIPDFVEEWRLTKYGKLLSRNEVLLKDDHGQIGRVEQLLGQCGTCSKFSFRGAPCDAHGGFTCAACLGEFVDEKGKVLRLCRDCLAVANFHKSNWLENDAPRRDAGAARSSNEP